METSNIEHRISNIEFRTAPARELNCGNYHCSRAQRPKRQRLAHSRTLTRISNRKDIHQVGVRQPSAFSFSHLQMSNVLWKLEGVNLGRRLSDVALTVETGVTAVLGHSGRGRLRLLDLLVGFEKADAGMLTTEPYWQGAPDSVVLGAAGWRVVAAFDGGGTY